MDFITNLNYFLIDLFSKLTVCFKGRVTKKSPDIVNIVNAFCLNTNLKKINSNIIIHSFIQSVLGNKKEMTTKGKGNGTCMIL